MTAQMLLAVANNVQALVMVQDNGLMLAYLADFQTCPHIVEAALRQNGSALEFASHFQAKRTLAWIAIRQNGLALQHVSPSIRDAGLVLGAVMQNGLALEFAPLCMQFDPGVVMAAVLNNGDAIRFATFLMKDCRQIAMSAVMQQPLAFNFLSDRLKDDEELANKGAHAYSTAILFGSGRLEVAMRMVFKDACGCWRGGGTPAVTPSILRTAVARGIRFCIGRRIHLCSSSSISTSSTLTPQQHSPTPQQQCCSMPAPSRRLTAAAKDRPPTSHGAAKRDNMDMARIESGTGLSRRVMAMISFIGRAWSSRSMEADQPLHQKAVAQG